MEQETKTSKVATVTNALKELCTKVYDWCYVEYVHLKFISYRVTDPLSDWLYRTFTSKTKQRLDAYYCMLEKQGYEPYDPEDWMYRSYRYLHPKRVYATRVDEKQGKITHELSVKPADFCSSTCKDFRKAGIRRCLREIEKDFSDLTGEEFRALNRHCNYIIETNRIVYELQKIAAKAKIYLRRIFGTKILGISLKYDWELPESTDII